MRKIFVILLLIAGCIPCPAQYPVWSDFYMAKMGSYYSLNVYRTPIRAWLQPDSITVRSYYADSARYLQYGTAYFAGTSYLRSDVPDTGTGNYIFTKNSRFGNGINDSAFVAGYYAHQIHFGSNPFNTERQFNFLGVRYDTTKAPFSYFGYEDWPDTSRINFFGGIDAHPLPNQFYWLNAPNYSDELGLNGEFYMPMKLSASGALILRPGNNFDSIVGGFNLYNPTDRNLEVWGGSYFDWINVQDSITTKLIITDTLKLTTVYKKAFGNAVANLRDTILCAGVKTDSTICNPAYIYDSGATTFNALMYYVRPDTIFTIRQAATDPDTFSMIVIKKK